MKNTIIKFSGILVLIFSLGLIFNVNADANESSLADVLKFQPTYKKSGSIKHGAKSYSFWTITDKKALDGSERKIVAISVYKKNSDEIIEQYYINYYQSGVVGYVKLKDPKKSEGDQWIMDVNHKDIAWYSKRFVFWIKNKDGKDWYIGQWLAKDTDKWLYGTYTHKLDNDKQEWRSYGNSITNIKSEINLEKIERKRLFQDGQKQGRKAEKIYNLLSNLEKKYYAKIIKQDPNKIAKKTKEKAPAEQATLEELKKVKKELEKVKKELAKKETLLKTADNQWLTDLLKPKPDYPNTKMTTEEKYYALVIGNNNYQYLEKLEAAENDARVLAEVLENNYGFDVKLLLNADYDTTVDSLYNISRKLTKEDNLLIFYAGHGEIDKKQNRGYWLPVDSSYEKRSKWISNMTVSDELKATEAKHVLLIVDSCFSGTLMRSASKVSSNKKLDEKYIKTLQSKKTRLVITSGGDEPVMDSDGGDHSLFAKKLIDTLKENKNVINTQTLFENIRQYVVKNAAQTPERAVIYKAGHDGGDFLFFSKAEASIPKVSEDYIGIGVNIETVAEGVKVVGVMKSSPAKKAGIKKGDIIIRADGIELGGKSVNEVASLIRGPSGSSVELYIGRNSGSYFDKLKQKAIGCTVFSLANSDCNVDYVNKKVLREKIKKGTKY